MIDGMRFILLRNGRSLPDIPAVYVITGYGSDSPDRLYLYVGMAEKLGRRIGAHHIILDLLPYSYLEIHWRPTEIERLVECEKDLIAQFNPRLNGKPGRKKTQIH